MKHEAVESGKIGKYAWRIEYDDDCASPRDPRHCDPMGKIWIGVRTNYHATEDGATPEWQYHAEKVAPLTEDGYPDISDDPLDDVYAKVERWEKDTGAVAVVVGNGYAHRDGGGFTADPAEGRAIGVFYCEASEVIKEYGGALGKLRKKPNKVARDKCRKYLLGDIETYNLWAAGECYGYVIEDTGTTDPDETDGENFDSCWGYIGRLSELQKEVEGMIARQIERDAQRAREEAAAADRAADWEARTAEPATLYP